MNSREIPIWIDERWYDALSKVLRNAARSIWRSNLPRVFSRCEAEAKTPPLPPVSRFERVFCRGGTVLPPEGNREI